MLNIFTKKQTDEDFARQYLYEKVQKYTVIDLETTGVNIHTDEIIEISAVRIRNGKIAGSFSSLVKPSGKIPEEATAVNNITDRMVRWAPRIEKVLPRFLKFIGTDVLVGHTLGGSMYRSLIGNAMR